MEQVTSLTCSSASPQFGQQTTVKKSAVKSALISTAKAVALAGAAGAITFGVTCLAAPAGIAAGTALTGYGVAKLAKHAFRSHYAHRYQLASRPLLDQQPDLGAPHLSNLIVSNSTVDSFKWKKELIMSAKKSIELSPNFAGGEDFREILNLIRNQMRTSPDLVTHIIMSRDLLEDEDKQLLADLRKEFDHRFNYLITDRIYTSSPTPRSEENHVKMLLVDGQYFSTGGTGIHKKMTHDEPPAVEGPNKGASKFLASAFRDTDIFGFGPQAESMRMQFFNLYRIWEHRMTGQAENRFFESPFFADDAGECLAFLTSPDLILEVETRFLVGGPEHRGANPIVTEMTHLIDSSKKEVRIANLLFNPTQQVSSSLAQKKAQNVAIKGYFNGTENGNTSHSIYKWPNRLNYGVFSTVHEYSRSNVLYHKKVATFDEQTAVIGTFNFGQKSAHCDYECVCVISDPRVTKLVNRALDEDAANSTVLQDSSLRWKTARSYVPGVLTSGILGNFFG